ncbi:MAG: stress response translation initiation inhibitor YciH [Dehalococcoidia bacterium]|nr:stress response translation initiation inhibitor YciH [Dehalococcoidia bacterium]
MSENRLVYSTDGGRAKATPPAQSSPRPAAKPGLPDDGVVRIFREKGGRGGKTVTVVRGLPERGAALEARSQELKRLCGAGGTLRDSAIEIQGDHRERIAEKLRSLGYQVRLAGG